MTSPWCEVKLKPNRISACGSDIEVTNCRQVRFMGVISHLHRELGEQLGLELASGLAFCLMQDQLSGWGPAHLHRRLQVFLNRQMGLWAGSIPCFGESFPWLGKVKKPQLRFTSL